jgi:hypothetical protein
VVFVPGIAGGPARRVVVRGHVWSLIAILMVVSLVALSATISRG